MALRQYDECFPSHPLRILEAIERDRKGLSFKSVFSNLEVYFTNEPSPSSTESDGFIDDYGDYIPYNSNENHIVDSKLKNGTKVYQDIALKEDISVKQSFPNPDSDFTNSNPNSVPIVTSKSKNSIKDNKLIAMLYKWYKIIIVKLFMKSLGTASVGFDSSVSEEELYEKQYKLFMAKKMWKKPLITSAILVAISIGLLIAANLM